MHHAPTNVHWKILYTAAVESIAHLTFELVQCTADHEVTPQKGKNVCTVIICLMLHISISI